MKFLFRTPLVFLILAITLINIVICFKPPKVKMLMNDTKARFFENAAVVTNSEICTEIALEILSEEGSAADAAIGALLCEGITNPQSMGIGGGFLLAYYNSGTKKVEILNARESAPQGASKQMFGPISFEDISLGGLSVAVPGEIKGYWALHKKYGKMSWYDVFRPTIDLCKSGVRITSYTAKIIQKVKKEIKESKSIKDLLTNPQTLNLYKEGDFMKRPVLADTLEEIAKYGPNALYNGNLTEDFITDIKENGGIITEDDLKNYRVLWEKPLIKNIGDFQINTVPLPGAGPLLLMILEIMAKKTNKKDVLYWHRLTETWKFAFGLRTALTGTLMGETSNFTFTKGHINKIKEKIKDSGVYEKPKDYFGLFESTEDHGTSHICIVAPNGDAVSVTSTINLSFGALFVSESTGIILNNEMMDFTIPGHYHSRETFGNQIAPNRQPLSSMLPTIILKKDSKELRLIIGSSGGFKILTSVSIVILEHLFLNKNLQEAVESKRLHHQLFPMILEFEEGFSEDILQLLANLGHSLRVLDDASKAGNVAMHSCVNVISVDDGKFQGIGDSRRKAFAAGY